MLNSSNSGIREPSCPDGDALTSGTPLRRLQLDPSRLLGFNVTHPMIGRPDLPLTLSPASDTGYTEDDITTDTTPVIIGSGETAGDTIKLYNNNTTLLGTTTVLADGSWSITTTPLAVGTYTLNGSEYTPGNAFAAGTNSPLALTIDPVPPVAFNLSLDASTDSGTQGDDITNFTAPIIDGHGLAGDYVDLYDGSTYVGYTTVGAGGTWSLATSGLTSRIHSFTALQSDADGNYAAASTALSVTVNAAPPAAANLTLAPVSDTGTRGDRITTVTTPVIAGTGEAGDTLTLSSGGVSIGSTTVAANGEWSIATSTLTLGTHALTAVQTNMFGTAGAVSTALSLTIGATVVGTPPAAPTLLFTDGSDQTVYATDGTSTIEIGNSVTTPIAANAPFGQSALSAVSLGSYTYIVMADTTGTTSALYRYDGTTINQITSSSNYVNTATDYNQSANAQPLTTYNGDVVFAEDTLANGAAATQQYATTKLAIYNPTTTTVSDLVVPNGGTDPEGFTQLGGDLYFIGTDTSANTQALYRYDGTSVAELSNANDPTGAIAAFNGKIYFGSTTESVYQYNPATSSESLVAQLYPYNPGSSARNFIVYSNKLYALSSTTGVYSFNTSNVSTQFVASIGALDFTPVVYNNLLYYVSDHINSANTALVSALYSYNGTSTTLVKDNVDPSKLTVFLGKLYDQDGASTLDSYNITTPNTLAVPGGAGNYSPLVVAPFALPDAAWSTPSTAVTVSSVIASPGAAELGAGQTVTFTLAMSAAVTVAGGTPTLTLGDGGTATYQPAASTGTNLVFSYLVASGDNTPDLTVTGVVLNGATIEGAGSIAAILAGAAANPAGILQIDTTAPTVNAASLAVAENAPATAIGIAPPTDPAQTAAQLTITAATLPGDGVVTLADGVTPVGVGTVLTSGQLGGLLFKPTTGSFATSSTFTYSVTDPAGNASTGSATLAIGPATGNPVAPSPAPVTVLENTSGNAMGIAAPTDPNYATAELVITVGTLPANGAVTLADGTTAVTAGEQLTAAQLTGLLFTPTAGQSSASSTFTYNVSDPADNVSAGSATLTIAPVATSGPSLAFASDSGTTGDDITNLTMPAVIGTGTPGDIVNLYDGTGATPVGTAIVTVGGTWSITPTAALADGLHNLTATQSYAGAASPASAALGLTIDTILPITPGMPVLAPAGDSGTPGDDITNATTPAITGSGITGDVVRLYDNNVLIGTGTVVAGSWSITPTMALANGPHSLAATQTDVAGNVSTGSDPLGLIIDTTLPIAPATPVLAPGSDSGTAGDSLTNATTPAITGTGVTGDIVSLYDGNVLVGTGTVVAGIWSITPTAPLANGVHLLAATQTDVAGNVSAASDLLGLTIDTAIPDMLALPVLAPASDSGTTGDDLTNIVAPAITGTGVTGDIISLHDGNILVGTGTVVAGIWSITPTLPLANGLHLLTATQTDVAGNVSAASAALGLTIDNATLAAPAGLTLATASDSGAVGDDITNATVPAITGSGITGDTVSLYDGNVLIGSGTVVAGSWLITPIAALANGLHSLTATQTDAAGNVSTGSAALDLTIDTAIPATPATPVLAPASDSGTAGDDLTNATTPAITGTGVTGNSVSLFDGNILIGSTTVTSDGTWSITPETALVNGVHSLTATQTDVAGNVSIASGILGLTIDTTVPAAPSGLLLASPSDSGVMGDNLTNVATPTITGSGLAGDIVSLHDGNALIGTAIVTPAGSWSITPANALDDGLHHLAATTTDAAGNISVASGTLDLTIETTASAAPASLLLAAASDSGTIGDDITSVTKPVITGTGTAGETIELHDGIAMIGTAVVGQNGVWSLPVGTALADGIHSLTATSTDAAGNVSLPSGVLSLAIETTASNAPANLALAAASDSGLAGDDLTSVVIPAITGTGTAGETISLYDGTGLLGTSIVAQNGIWSVTPAAGLADGVHGLFVTTTNVAGDVSAASDILDLTIDTTTPAAPTGLLLAPVSDSGLSGDGLTNVTTPAITGAGTAGDTVTLTDGGTLLGSAIVAADGSWSITPAAALADGAHTLAATATNPAGTASPASATLSLVIDATASAAPGNLALAPAGDSGTLGDRITDVTRPAVTGTGTPGETIRLLDGPGLLGTAVVTQDGNWSIVPANPLTDGLHSLTATTTDAAGNISLASPVFGLTIDSTASAAPTRLSVAAASDSGTQNDDLTNVTSPVIDGLGTAGETIRLYDGTSLLGTTIVARNGGWSITPAGALADGVHRLTATSIDAAGNVSSASPALALTIDTAAVAPPTVAQTTSATASATPVLTGSADAGSSIGLYDGSTLLGTTTANASGLYTYALTAALSVGTHALTARETNLAGNLSAASVVLTVTVNDDSSYAIVSPPDSSGDTTSRVYDGSGHYTSVDTTDGTGLLLQSVSPTSTIRNIYDSAGKLIGTIGEAGSATGVAQPDFATARLTGGAITATDTTASLVTLLSEDHSLTLQGNDTVRIDTGNDTISAGSGAVSVTGGAGALTFYGNAGTSTVTGGAGSATVVGGGGGGIYAGGSSAGNLLVAASGNTTLVGGTSHDVLFGGSGQNAIYGSAAGSDIVIAGSGSNIIAASDNDVVFTAGQSTVYGGAAGGDTVVGSGNDVMVAGGGTNALFGGAGHDTMYGGSGATVMVGSSGSALMVGGPGSSDFVGGSGQSTVFGGAGNDTVWSGTGSMTAVLGNGADTVVLEAGSASVFGGFGSDVYDVINGSAGGNDMISGFKVGTDQIALYGYNASAVQTTSGGSTILDLTDGTRITLLNVTDLKSNSIV